MDDDYVMIDMFAIRMLGGGGGRVIEMELIRAQNDYLLDHEEP